jgi:hypothetical protein
MSTATITLEIPENIYQHLVDTAKATQKPLEEIILQVVKVGSPPALDDIPEQFKPELLKLYQLDDQSLWTIATQKKASTDCDNYETLLSKSKEIGLTETEQNELNQMRYEFDLFMLSKAHAAALLRWRGYQLLSN